MVASVVAGTRGRAAENVVASAAENVVASAAENVVASAAENVVANAAVNKVVPSAINDVQNSNALSSGGLKHDGCLEKFLWACSLEDLEAMGEAALRILECYRVLRKSDTSVVAEILRGADEFVEWEHFPLDDVIDDETHCQYFYHAHSPDDSDGGWGDEHGHFHTFVQRGAIPDGIEPADAPGRRGPDCGAQTNCHLVAISMNAASQPTRLFTVNRWVTGDTWYAAKDVISLLPLFQIDLALPSWPVNIWITDMLRLFRPQIEQLLLGRDATLAAWANEHSGENPYETEALDVLSVMDISVEQQVFAVDRALKARGQTGFVT